MKYTVSIAVDGRIDIDVEADSFEQAKDKAIDAFRDADLAQMEVVGGQAVNAEAETGEFRDY